jgi:hypothetical protein
MSAPDRSQLLELIEQTAKMQTLARQFLQPPRHLIDDTDRQEAQALMRGACSAEAALRRWAGLPPVRRS